MNLKRGIKARVKKNDESLRKIDRQWKIVERELTVPPRPPRVMLLKR